jgi:tetratricopeptide (TPR) repeat protein
MTRLLLTAIVVAGLAGETATLAATTDEVELARQPSWAIPEVGAFHGPIAAWLAELAPDAAPPGTVDRLRDEWRKPTAATAPADLLDTLMETAATVDAGARDLRSRAGSADDLTTPLAALDRTGLPPFLRDAIRLWLGRELVRQERFDEALPLLTNLDVATSVDPAALLFHRAACQHWLLDADGALESLDRLLEREAEIPVRYARLARLLRSDAAALEADSLDHIARRMRDVTRRLDHGRADPDTRSVQKSVIASLDKLIDDLEQQQRQQQPQGGAGSGGGGLGPAGRPMDESRSAGGRGTGEVQKRDIGSGDGWGNLPPHEREQALQQIGREFPPHYREAIEQYFKRLATGAEDSPTP